MASTVPSSARVFWPSTVASIPANWSRDTDFDGRFLQGDSTAGTNGGATTHSHTADSHTHTFSAHTHSLTISGNASGGTVIASTAGGFTAFIATDGHTHNAGTTASATSTESGTVITINSTDSRPPYYSLIIIKPVDGSQDVPNSSVVLSNQSIAPSGFSVTGGSGGTPNLDGRFILGAATSADAGATGGSTTHTHTSPAHSLTVNSHTHADSSFGISSSASLISGASSACSNTGHHTATSIGNSYSTFDTETVTVNSVSSEPAFYQLLGLQNTSGGASTPDGIILPYTGTGGSIPSGWYLCDGTNNTPNLSAKQIRITADVAKVGVTGGSNTHTHTTVTHTHVESVAHTHSYTFNTVASATVTNARSGTTVSNASHAHIGSSMAQAFDPPNDATVTMSTDDIRYSYRTVLWIQKGGQPTVIINGGIIQGAIIP